MADARPSSSHHRTAAASVTTSSFLPSVQWDNLEGELLGQHLLADVGAAAAASALVAPFVRCVLSAPGPVCVAPAGLGWFSDKVPAVLEKIDPDL